MQTKNYTMQIIRDKPNVKSTKPKIIINQRLNRIETVEVSRYTIPEKPSKSS